MSTYEKEIVLKSDFVDFVDSEYDFVTNDDFILMSEQVHNEQYETRDKVSCTPSFSAINQYKEEWAELYYTEEVDLHKLQKLSVEGQLRTSRFRSICWRCLLGILHNQPKQWICQLKMYRKHYNEICTELEQKPWDVKGNKNPYDNPLSQDSDSIWQKYFSDEDLKAVIHQDVKRTFPGMEFFKRKDIQKIMVRILFCYAKQNPALCYRQGMHEILAPLIFILYCDQQAFLHAKEQIPNLHEDIYEILDPNYLEQDAHNIFKYIMNHIECSYRLNNLMTAVNLPVDALKCENYAFQNEVISRLDHIKKNILQPKDPELSEHLHKLDIPLHLFGIRWLRLLFGREFSLQDLLVLWDFIFSNNFETVNFIVVAMLIAIRQILLNGDYTDCLSNLMKYPSGVDVNFIINYALYLKDPQKHMCPDISKSFYHSATTTIKPSSDNMNSQSQFNKRLRKEVSRQTRWFYDKPNLLAGNGEGSIAAGYVADDPNLLKAELEHTKTILTVVRHKLVQFHAVLTGNLQNNVSTDVQEALDGIFELSCLLKVYNKEVICDVETACEAGETKQIKVQNQNLDLTPQLKKINSIEASINSEKKCHTLPKTKKNPKSGELKVFKHHVGGIIKGVPMTDPLHLIKHLFQDDDLEAVSK